MLLDYKSVEKSIKEALTVLTSPYLGCSMLTVSRIDYINLVNDQLNVGIVFFFPIKGLCKSLNAQIANTLQSFFIDFKINVEISWKLKAKQNKTDCSNLAKVENIIAIASAKGGVGKSTVAVNLALALVAEGAKVGLLDADIYGPSQGIMLGINDSYTHLHGDKGQGLTPIIKHGLSVMSIAFLIDKKTPIIWRGPMVSGAIQQLIEKTEWGTLDYLLIDMPPGTGDIHLTVCQKISLSGAVVVTTPQVVALEDARKAIEMFNKTEVPILGIVENMSSYICSSCGHESHLFSKQGGAIIANEYKLPLLGKLPLNPSIGKDVENGTPSMIAKTNKSIEDLFSDIARYMSSVLANPERVDIGGVPAVIFYND